MNNRLVVLTGILLLVAAAGCISLQKYSQQVPSASDFSYRVSESSDSIKGGGTDIYGEKVISQDRKIISTAYLQMEVSSVKDTFDEVINITLRQGGYISSSSVYDSGNHNSGQVSLRVPQKNFYSAVEQIGALGTVRSRQISGQDVTEEFIDVNARLGNLKKQEVRLQEILKTAVTVKDVLEVEHELERVRGEIERLTGRINYLNQSVEMSTITVNAAEPVPFTGENWGIADTFSQAARGFVESVKGLVIVTGYILPILIFTTLIIIAALGIRRKFLPRFRI